jgi:hypothetical protein
VNADSKTIVWAAGTALVVVLVVLVISAAGGTGGGGSGVAIPRAAVLAAVQATDAVIASVGEEPGPDGKPVPVYRATVGARTAWVYVRSNHVLRVDDFGEGTHGAAIAADTGRTTAEAYLRSIGCANLLSLQLRPSVTAVPSQGVRSYTWQARAASGAWLPSGGRVQVGTNGRAIAFLSTDSSVTVAMDPKVTKDAAIASARKAATAPVRLKAVAELEVLALPIAGQPSMQRLLWEVTFLGKDGARAGYTLLDAWTGEVVDVSRVG